MKRIYFFNDQNLFFKTQTTWGFQVNKERLIVGDVRLHQFQYRNLCNGSSSISFNLPLNPWDSIQQTLTNVILGFTSI